MASTFPKVKKSSTSKTSSVSKEVVHVRLCLRPIHSHGIARSNTNQVNEIQLLPIVKASESIEPNKNDLELNVIAYTFSKIF